LLSVAMTLLTLTPGAEATQDQPRPPGVTQPAQPFGTMPFPRAVSPLLTVSSGWYIAEDELGVIGEDFHEGLDFDGVPCQTPILAVADGWAVASYQSGIARGGQAPFNPADPSNPETDWRDPVSGREGWLGFAGLFVELQTNVQVPGFQNAVAQYFHLSAVNPRITWLDPVREPDTITWNGKRVENWFPAPVRQSQADIRRIATPVKRGDVIGWIGDTGINFGYNDRFDPAHHVVWPRNRHALPPWDPQGAGITTPISFACQLHLEFYSGRSEEFGKLNRFDGMDLYRRVTGIPGTSSYHNPYNPRPGIFRMGSHPIFIRDRHGQPVYAR
jgi:hypothetical protein